MNSLNIYSNHLSSIINENNFSVVKKTNNNISFKGSKLDLLKLSGIDVFQDFKVKRLMPQSKETAIATASTAYETSKNLFHNKFVEHSIVLYKLAVDKLKDLNIIPDKEFFEHGGDIFRHIGDFDNANNLYQNAYTQAKTLGDKPSENSILFKLIENHMLNGQPENALQLINNNLGKSASPELLKKKMFLTSCIYAQKDGSDKAASLIKLIPDRTMSEIRKSEDYVYSYMLALIMKNKGDLFGSSKICSEIVESLKMKNKTADTMYEKTNEMLAENYYNIYLKNPEKNPKLLDKSISTYEESYKTSLLIGNKKNVDLTASKLGNILFSQNKFPEAKRYLIKVINSKPATELDDITMQNVWKTMAEISKKEGNQEESILYLNEERKYLQEDSLEINSLSLANAYKTLAKKAEDESKFKPAIEHLNTALQYSHDVKNNDSILEEITSKLAEIHIKNNDPDEANKVISENKKYVRINDYKDIAPIVNKLHSVKNYKRAAEIINQFLKDSGINPGERGMALLNLGLSKILLNDSYHGIKDLQDGTAILEKYIIENKDDRKTLSTLYNAYKLITRVSFERREYTRAAEACEMSYNLISPKRNLFKVVDSSPSDKEINDRNVIPKQEFNNIIKNTANMFYKAENYQQTVNYFTRYLRGFLGKEFKYEKLITDDFVNEVLDNYSPAEYREIAHAIELLGVANVKDVKFINARNCFKSALKLRREADGNGISVANNLRALAKLSRENYFVDSKQYYQEALKLMKDVLGENNPEYINEKNFYDGFFGFGLVSSTKWGGRWAYSGIEAFKRFVCGETKDDAAKENEYKQMIIKDFHLMFEVTGL